VRRLLLLVCAIVLVDTMLYAALAPLLPGYAEDYGLSKTGAGILVASYAAGVLVGGVPSGIVAARLGPKPVALAGLALLGIASVGFAVASDPWPLGIARLFQGFASALSWAGGFAWLVAHAPRERRGELLGTALGAAIFGALLGPVLGAAAALAGTRPAFLAIAAGAVLLGVWGARVPGAPPEAMDAGATVRAFAEVRFVGGMWLMLLPAFLFGVLAVLVPLELDAFGWGAAAIGAVFLVSAGLQAVVTPFLGRLADRRGRLRPVRWSLAASVGVSLALALAARPALVAGLVLLAAVAYGALFAPGMALISDGAERAGLSQALAFGLMNAAWAIGTVAGPAGGGALAEAVSDGAAYVLLAGVCLATLLAAQSRLAFWHSPSASAKAPLAGPGARR
jgi:MFS family permease